MERIPCLHRIRFLFNLNQEACSILQYPFCSHFLGLSVCTNVRIKEPDSDLCFRRRCSRASFDAMQEQDEQAAIGILRTAEGVLSSGGPRGRPAARTASSSNTGDASVGDRTTEL